VLNNELDEKEEDGDENKKPESPLDFTIILSDSTGEKLTFLLSEFSHLQRQIKSRVMRVDFLDKNDHSENIFQTFFFDLEKMRILNPKFRFTSLLEIRFEFDQNESGVIILDKIGYMKKLNISKLN
jgi:hypothetical protein